MRFGIATKVKSRWDLFFELGFPRPFYNRPYAPLDSLGNLGNATMLPQAPFIIKLSHSLIITLKIP